MENKRFAEMTNEELLIEKQKLKKSKIFHATLIGFLSGVLIFGIVSWSLSADRKWGFFIPMLFPVYFIYSTIKNSKNNKELEDILKERQIN